MQTSENKIYVQQFPQSFDEIAGHTSAIEEKHTGALWVTSISLLIATFQHYD